jgi:hypothetical protein
MMQTVDIGIFLYYLKLVETRMLINAGSGGGKSWLIRKMLEQICGKLHQIVFDYEGEFVTLREKFPFALVAVHGGDIPLSVRSAAKLAQMIMETNLSVIIDLYDLEPDDRVQFVHEFLHALMKLNKELYHPTLIYIDEIDVFCPQVGMTAASKDIRNLAARGRKRGLGTIFATQRLSKVHKDVAAECLNKMFGQTTLGIDVSRAAEELGMSTKEQGVFRELEPGNFLAYGPAFESRKVTQFTVGQVETTHVKAGTMVSAPPTPDAIRAILSQLKDMPADEDTEEEEESPSREKKVNQDIVRYQQDIATLQGEKVALQKNLEEVKAIMARIHQLSSGDDEALAYVPVEPVKVSDNIPASQKTAPTVRFKDARPVPLLPLAESGTLGKCARAIVTLLASFPDREFSKAQVAIATNYSVNSGSFSNALAELNTKNMISRTTKGLKVNKASMVAIIEAVGQITRKRFDISTFRSRLGKCEAEIYEVILKHSASV